MWKLTAMTAVVTLFAAASVFEAQADKVGLGKDVKRESKRKNPLPTKDPKTPELPNLKVFEWGVHTINFDGTAQEQEVLPAYMHKAEDIKLEVAPVKPNPDNPVPGPRPPMPIRKPVLYFECTKDLTFDLDVHFTSGQLTWVYPKGNRRTNAATMQWDNIQLYTDNVTKRKKMPQLTLPEVDAEHWAAFSRDGSTSTISVNGESERYLFYEGERGGLPDVDVYKNADGEIVIANHTDHDIHAVRLVLDGKRWFVKQVSAMSGSTAGTTVLVEDAKTDDTGDIAKEATTAGLTVSQGKVFERVWQKDFEADNTLSWRRTQKALDEMMELKLTLPAGIGSEVKRVGYVMMQGVSLERQGEFEALVVKARAGDADAVKVLGKGGVLAVGAVRRAMTSKDVSLKERLALAKILGAMAE